MLHLGELYNLDPFYWSALKKNLLYLLILGVSLTAMALFRTKEKQEAIRIGGYTMGSTYQVIYFDKEKRDFKGSLDSLLMLVNKSINTYDSTSEVSRFNKGERIDFRLPYLYPPLKISEDIHKQSRGAFDVTVMPLVNAWGFGPAKVMHMDSSRVDSLRAFVGFDKLRITETGISKTDPRVQLDFGGIGQGYGADVIKDFLESKGISDFLIELGGEGNVAGENLEKETTWTIGILDPRSTRENQLYKVYVSLTDRAYTTSGNYFNYREVDGKKYSHTIDPSTGYPAERAILSASVFADDCATADAWATAFMVMGHERAIEWIQSHSGMDAIIMYSTPDKDVELFISEGIKSQVTVEHDSL
jgi:thiamine biosynthesis lipoprotein